MMETVLAPAQRGWQEFQRKETAQDDRFQPLSKKILNTLFSVRTHPTGSAFLNAVAVNLRQGFCPRVSGISSRKLLSGLYLRL